MMREDDLREDSGRLEAAFFVGENATLLQQLRLRTDEERLREELREVVKVKHERFLDRLVALGVRPETALALTLIPLLFVAWADGQLDERERKALLDAAQQRGGRALADASEPPAVHPRGGGGRGRIPRPDVEDLGGGAQDPPGDRSAPGLA